MGDVLAVFLAAVLALSADASTANSNVHGSVVSGRDPIPGATVRLRNAEGIDRYTISDADGRFAIVAPRGTYEISASLEGFDTTVDKIEVSQTKEHALTLDLRPLSASETFTITCVLPNFMNGRVTDGENRPVVGARISLDSGGTSVTTTTDERGEFGFMYGAGDRSGYSLHIAKDGFQRQVIHGKLAGIGFDVSITLAERTGPCRCA